MRKPTPDAARTWPPARATPRGTCSQILPRKTAEPPAEIRGRSKTIIRPTVRAKTRPASKVLARNGHAREPNTARRELPKRTNAPQSTLSAARAICLFGLYLVVLSFLAGPSPGIRWYQPADFEHTQLRGRNSCTDMWSRARPPDVAAIAEASGRTTFRRPGRCGRSSAAMATRGCPWRWPRALSDAIPVKD